MRRPYLLSNTVLKQNPNSVHSWMERIKMSRGDHEMTLKTYKDAIATIDPKRCQGQFYHVWIGFARFYESYQDLENANQVFHQAV